MKILPLFYLLLSVSLFASKPLNILIITADDMNWDSPGCYGNPLGDTTPNIDKLASQGLRFDNAHISAAACYPSRNAISTGRRGHRSGGEGFHYLRFPDIPTVQQLLHDNGYYVGIYGKVPHSTPYEDTPWDYAKESHRNTEDFYIHSKEFIAEAKAANKPFYFVVNSHDPHRPYYNIEHEGKEIKVRPAQAKKGIKANSHPSKVYQPNEVPIPKTLPDHPDVRKELADYYSTVRRFDDVLGRMMDVVEEEDLAKNTLIIFLSDHGMANPAAKANAYIHSTKVPFIVRWDGNIEPGTVDRDHIVSSLDILPTILEATNISSPGGFDGASLVSIFNGEKQDNRATIHTEFYSTSGKNHFQMRTAISSKYAYVFNAWHTGDPVYTSSSMGGDCFKSMLAVGKEEPFWDKRAQFLLTRSPEELYDIQNDPDCLHNLIDDPAYQEAKQELQKRMKLWLTNNDDYLSSVFNTWLTTESVDSMSAEFAQVIQNEKLIGKAPVKPVDMQRWLDPDYKKKKQKTKKKKKDS